MKPRMMVVRSEDLAHEIAAKLRHEGKQPIIRRYATGWEVNW